MIRGVSHLRLVVTAVGAAACCSTRERCEDDASALLQVSWKPASSGEKKEGAFLVIDMQNDFIDGSLTVIGGDAIIPTINQLAALPWSTVVYTMDYHPANHISFADNFPTPLDAFASVELSYNEKLQVCGADFVELYGDSADESCAKGQAGITTFSQTLWPTHCVQGTVGSHLDSRLQVPTKAAFVKKGFTSVSDSYGAFETNVAFLGHPDRVLQGDQTENNLGNLLATAGIKRVYVAGLALDYCVKFTALQAKEFGYDVYLVTDAAKAVTDATGKAALLELERAGVHLVTSQSLVDRPELLR